MTIQLLRFCSIPRRILWLDHLGVDVSGPFLVMSIPRWEYLVEIIPVSCLLTLILEINFFPIM